MVRSSATISRSPHRARRAPRGIVLVIVLVVIVVLALAAYNFAGSMVNEHTAVDLSARQVQARMQVDSGVDLMRIFLTQSPEDRRAAGGVYDNPDRFQGQLVVDDEAAALRGRVALLSSALDDNGQVSGLRYGFCDESARLNLNSLIMADQQIEGSGRRLLMALPGMTEEIADSILDFLDSDDDPREFGCESEYYTTLDPPYAARNGPLETVEELLLVRGVTPELLFGGDTNRNGVLDPHENPAGTGGGSSTTGPQAKSGPQYKAPAGTGPTSSPTTNPTGGANAAAANPIVDNVQLDLGWAPFLTLYSMEKNMRANGQPRVNINQNDLQQLYNELVQVVPGDWATFIVSYRLNGPFTGTATGANAPQKGVKDAPYINGAAGKMPITQVLDLIGAKVQTRLASATTNIVLDSPFASDPISMAVYMPMLMDAVTVNPHPVIPGRVNINQAPEPILRGIPGITEEIVQEIIANRTYETAEEKPNRRFETWLLVEGVVTADQMKQLMPFICGGGDVYRAQIVGYFDGGGPSARAEVVLDASGSYPRVLFWRDLSHLGRGFDLETLGIEVDVE